MNKLGCLLFVLCFVMSSNAFALSCGNAKIVVDHPSYEQVLGSAGALYDIDRNIIALSTEYMSGRSLNVQRFIFAHECGHHKLSGGSEIGADNYAIKVAKKNGATFSESELNEICRDIGPDRCSNIRNQLRQK
jgi:hypothetical protein